jgi:hypothetical protein
MREFMVSTGGITVVGATTLIAFQPAAAPAVNIETLRFWVSQSANATSAQQRVELATKASVFPTLTTYTPSKLKVADANASTLVGGTAVVPGSVGINASAEGAGTQTIIMDDAFNVLNGWLHVPTPAETRVFPASYASGVELYFPVTPGTTTNWAFGMIYREI